MQTDVAARQSNFIDDDDRSLTSVFSAYVVTATLWLLFATGVGLLMAYKFSAPEFGAGEWLTLGRLRPIHTNATFFGFASIALVGLGFMLEGDPSFIEVDCRFISPVTKSERANFNGNCGDIGFVIRTDSIIAVQIFPIGDSRNGRGVHARNRSSCVYGRCDLLSAGICR
ncbi:MAG: hypothetical protein ACLPTF_06280 [Steroidobacteraceae bacterium]